MSVSAYPLCWPETLPRSRSRETGGFKTSLSGALENVRSSLRLFAKDSGVPISSLVISSNVTLGAERPQDPGVAVWFVWDGRQVCIAVDRYATVAANLQAIHHIIEARRVELRHGTLAMVRATFTGFVALPTPKDCWTVLGLAPGADRDAVERAYRDLAKRHHPDAGGSQAAMAELNDARDRALRQIGAD